MRQIAIGAFSIAVVCISCQSNKSTESNTGIGIDLAGIDSSINPADDFYKFVNGKWFANNTIPASEATWSNFNVIENNNKTNLRILFEELASKTHTANTPSQQIGDLYYTAMDSVKLNTDGIKPLEEELKKIEAIASTTDLINAIAHHHQVGVKTLFDFGVGADPKNSNLNISQFFQGGLGLPDMDYYINQEDGIKKIRAQYQTHIINMFKLAGVTEKDAAKIASDIIKLETELAKVSMTRVELRNIEAQYNKRTKDEFYKQHGDINWNNYFTTLGIENKVTDLIIGQPKFFSQINSLFKSVSIAEWKNYLKWNLLSNSANKLSDDLVAESFNFYGTTLNGSKALKPRWKRAIAQSDNALGELVGKIYVEKYFPVEAKQKVNTMVDNLTAAYQERIMSRDWMSDATKQQALNKLSTIMRKLAYPDKWRDYSALTITRDSYLQNIMNAYTFEYNFMLSKLGKPVDKTEWGMSAPTVNAYYNASYNEIVFPAGIMQVPFFNKDADDAVNYGAMGAIIGHELTHGFDDQGCQFDSEGNMKNWWTKEDSTKFSAKTNMLVEQYNAMTELDSIHVNGNLTLGENIADLGGLTMAYYALKKSIEGKEVKKVDGYTPEQRFFMSWAQGWRGLMRDEYMKQYLKTNPHAPYDTRVNGPLSNMKEFYEAFGVKEGDKLYRKDRAEIW